MIETAINATFTIACITIMLMLLTAPGWIVGQLVARQTRVLPVPVILRPKVVRWALWYLTGIASLVALVLATRPVGALEAGTRAVMVAVSLAAFAIAMALSFYIGWTSAATRLARRGHAESAPPPVMPAYPPTEGGPQLLPQQLPQEPPAADEYAPATPNDDDGYQPAVRHPQ